MKRFIDYRPGPRHCFIARAVVLLARRRLEMSIMPGCVIKPRVRDSSLDHLTYANGRVGRRRVAPRESSFT